jgi:anti-sigma-K factor RskA
MEPSPSTPPQSAGHSGYWRAAAIFLALLLLLGGTAGVSMYQQFVAQMHDLQQKLQQTASLQYVAVLMDDKGEPAILLTQSAGEGFLQLQRLSSVEEGPEDSMQLWALSEGAPARSLGILQPRLKTLRLPLTEPGLEGVATLGMSVEAKGGVSQPQGPRLPYLFTAKVIRKAL